MDPSSAELASLSSLTDVLEWIGIKDSFKAAIDAAFGEITMLRQVVLIPLPAWERAAMNIKIQVKKLPQPIVAEGEGAKSEGSTPTPDQFRPPSAVEHGHLASLRRVARLRLGLPPDEDVGGGPRVIGDGGGAALGGGSVAVRRIKLAVSSIRVMMLRFRPGM